MTLGKAEAHTKKSFFPPRHCPLGVKRRRAEIAEQVVERMRALAGSG